MNSLSTQELGTLFKSFLAELPNPNDCPQRSITELFYIHGNQVMLQACKTRGMEGLIWNVDIVS